MAMKVKDTGLVSDSLEQELKNLKIRKLLKEHLEKHPDLSDEDYDKVKNEIERKVYSEKE